MESKYKKLVKNTAIFAIGEFASKILNFLIVPLYTYILTTDEYGRIDLFTTTISFFIPFITLMIQEALIRFLLGKEIDEKSAISNCWFIYICGIGAIVLLFPGYQQFFKETKLSLLFCSMCMLSSFNNIFTHYLKSIGRNVAYAIKGIITTIAMLSLNVLFLVVFKMGMYGYLYAMLASQLVGVSYLLIAGGLARKLTLKYLQFASLRLMLKFSIPLIPNSLMWWIMSAGDKYIINGFLGDGANGLYSLSLKIPTIISMFYSLFFQAWQMSAIEENESAGRKEFYESIYKTTNALLFFLVAFITIGVKIVFKVMSESFYPSWIFVPILSFATAFSCQSSFFGVVYTTSKKTNMAFYTTALGAAINLVFNFSLIRPLGLQGVAIGTLLGYVIVMLIRAKDARKEINMSFDLRRTIISCLAVSAQIAVTILFNDVSMYIVGTGTLVLLFWLYKSENGILLGKIKQMIRR